MAQYNQALAFRWLSLVLSTDCPLSPTEKLVMSAVFQRVDWDSGHGFFESARSLAERLGISKSSAAAALRAACNVGPFLRRAGRATGNESWRRGFTYSLAFPGNSLSPCTDRDGKDCPATGTEEGSLSKTDGGSVQNEAQLCPATGTYSPLNPLKNPSERAKAPRVQSPPRGATVDPEARQRVQAKASAIGYRAQADSETFERYAAAVALAYVEAQAAMRGRAT